MADKVKLLEPEHAGPSWGDVSKVAWEDNSFAVVACNGSGVGVVLWTGGPHVAFEISQGSAKLDDLGLDDAPAGISVWEGKYLWHPGSYEYPQDGATEPNGRFRSPTLEEWEAIKAGECPWDDEDWRSVK